MSELIWFEANGEQLWIGREEVEVKSHFYATQLKQLTKLNRTGCTHLSRRYLTALAVKCYN